MYMRGVLAKSPLSRRASFGHAFQAITSQNCAVRTVEFWPIEYLRMKFLKEIDTLRVTIWLEKLFEMTETETILALAKRVDPGSFWLDDDQIEKQSKWYCFFRDFQVPSRSLSNAVQRQVPKAYSELHHPMWRLLRNSKLSERTVRRLKSEMTAELAYAYAEVGKMDLDQLKISVALVDALRLDRLGYLDALFVFAIARNVLIRSGDLQRATRYSTIMWALPVLYPDDAIWSHDNLARHDCVLDLIDSSLELKTIVATGLHGLRVDRGQSLFEQHWAAKQYQLSAPRALTSHIAKRRYFARRPTRFIFKN